MVNLGGYNSFVGETIETEAVELLYSSENRLSCERAIQDAQQQLKTYQHEARQLERRIKDTEANIAEWEREIAAYDDYKRGGGRL